MSRTSTGKPVKEIIREYLQGQRLAGRSKGPAIYINPDDAERLASELAELLPKSSGPKSWIGYGLDRSTVLCQGSSKSEIKSQWMFDIQAKSSDVRTVYSSSGIYRYSFTAPDLSSHDIWIVQAGTDGFGSEVS